MSAHLQPPPQSRLLALPGELKNRIYRAVLVTGSAVRVSATHHVEPALLKVSKEIRAEAGSIYYAENTFQVDCHHWDPAVVLLWEQKRIKVKQEFRASAKSTITVYQAMAPHWSNLLRWLKLFHGEDTQCHYSIQAERSPGAGTGATRFLEEHIVSGLFVLAMEFRGTAWQKIETTIENQHVALTALNHAWA